MIRLESVTRVFRLGDEEIRALDRVDLEIARGEYVSIMGPSGSGKSTLLHIVGLLDRPSEGRYFLDGRDTSRLDEDELARLRNRKIGFVFQFFHLVGRLTAAENIELPMILAGIPPARRRERVRRALETFGLADRAAHRPDELSGGQRQRVAIARATVLEPEVLLADEPTGNLDRQSGAEVIGTLERLNEQGITLLLVTHDPELGRRAPRRIRLRDGRIAADDRDTVGSRDDPTRLPGA